MSNDVANPYEAPAKTQAGKSRFKAWQYLCVAYCVVPAAPVLPLIGLALADACPTFINPAIWQLLRSGQIVFVFAAIGAELLGAFCAAKAFRRGSIWIKVASVIPGLVALLSLCGFVHMFLTTNVLTNLLASF